MISQPTVLILGAGASAPYGFPCGGELLLRICGESAAQGPIAHQLSHLGFAREQILAFQHELRDSSQRSVDAFLEGRPEYVDIGKHAIALALIPCEHPAQLQRQKEQRWYEYLFGLLTADRKDFWRNRLSVVTFNYDRSLEYFLFTSLQCSYGLDRREVIELMQHIPVMHVNGQLGVPDFLDPGGRPYDPSASQEATVKAVAGIEVMREDAGPSTQLRQAWVHIHNAEVVCFLGFGYHPLNIRRLGLDKYDGMALLGSAWGLEHFERKRTISLLSESWVGDRAEHGIESIAAREAFGGVKLGEVDEDVLTFLRRYPALKAQ